MNIAASQEKIQWDKSGIVMCQKLDYRRKCLLLVKRSILKSLTSWYFMSVSLSSLILFSCSNLFTFVFNIYKTSQIAELVS